MRTKQKVSVLFAMMLMSAGGTLVPAHAAPVRVKAGTLTCYGQGTIGLIVGSKQELDCRFKPVGDRPSNRYTATITKIGLDVGIVGKSVLAWTVLFSTSSYGSRFIAGNYVGAAADASVGVGGGANLLVGGNGKSVTLQPLSVQGQTGLNLAVGVAEMEIR